MLMTGSGSGIGGGGNGGGAVAAGCMMRCSGDRGIGWLEDGPSAPGSPAKTSLFQI